jgi:hypothetical protein
MRDEPHQLVPGRRPDVRELLLTSGVDVHVIRARVLTDDHALIHLSSRADEERSALLQVEQGVRRDRAAPIGNE